MTKVGRMGEAGSFLFRLAALGTFPRGEGFRTGEVTKVAGAGQLVPSSSVTFGDSFPRGEASALSLGGRLWEVYDEKL